MEPIKVNRGEEDYPAYLTSDDSIFTVTRRYEHGDMKIITALSSENGYLIDAPHVHFCGKDSILLQNLDNKLAKHCNHCAEPGVFIVETDKYGGGFVHIPGSEYTLKWSTGNDPQRMQPCSLFTISLGPDNIGHGVIHKKGCCDLRISGFVPPNFLTLLEEVIGTIHREVTCSS